MSPRFLIAVAFVLKWETVFEKGHDGDFNDVETEHDPDDPGGTTRFGIDQSDHPGVDVENLTEDQAKEIYWRGEWTASHAELLPAAVGEALFDSAVNCGQARANKWLQQALNAHGDYQGQIDGIIGPMTLAAAASASAASTAAGIISRRALYYRDLATAQPKLAKYLNGWLNRVTDLQQFVKPMTANA